MRLASHVSQLTVQVQVQRTYVRVKFSLPVIPTVLCTVVCTYYSTGTCTCTIPGTSTSTSNSAVDCWSDSRTKMKLEDTTFWFFVICPKREGDSNTNSNAIVAWSAVSFPLVRPSNSLKIHVYSLLLFLEAVLFYHVVVVSLSPHIIWYIRSCIHHHITKRQSDTHKNKLQT